MELVVGALKVAALALVVYGGALCLWHRATERPGERRVRRYRGPRSTRLIAELGKRRAREPEEATALPVEPVILRKAA
jgi:hypothetical protein